LKRKGLTVVVPLHNHRMSGFYSIVISDPSGSQVFRAEVVERNAYVLASMVLPMDTSLTSRSGFPWPLLQAVVSPDGKEPPKDKKQEKVEVKKPGKGDSGKVAVDTSKYPKAPTRQPNGAILANMVTYLVRVGKEKGRSTIQAWLRDDASKVIGDIWDRAVVAYTALGQIPDKEGKTATTSLPLSDTLHSYWIMKKRGLPEGERKILKVCVLYAAQKQGYSMFDKRPEDDIWDFLLSCSSQKDADDRAAVYASRLPFSPFVDLMTATGSMRDMLFTVARSRYMFDSQLPLWTDAVSRLDNDDANLIKRELSIDDPRQPTLREEMVKRAGKLAAVEPPVFHDPQVEFIAVMADFPDMVGKVTYEETKIWEFRGSDAQRAGDLSKGGVLALIQAIREWGEVEGQFVHQPLKVGSTYVVCMNTLIQTLGSTLYRTPEGALVSLDDTMVQ